MTTFPSSPHHCHHVRHLPQGLGEPRKSTSSDAKTPLFRSDAGTQLSDFFSNPQNPPRTLPVHDVIHIPRSYFLPGVSIVTSLNDTSAPRAREHLRSCLHLTNQCAKRKVLSLTKPKGKIYKTKSLGHYITRFPYQSYGDQSALLFSEK